jgi:hypothetical protein
VETIDIEGLAVRRCVQRGAQQHEKKRGCKWPSFLSSQMSPQGIDMQKVELRPWVQKENAARSCRARNRLAVLPIRNSSRLSIEGQGKALPDTVNMFV